jgi:hypothetical protein
MMRQAALGIKLHTGWATLVAVAGDPSAIQVVLRCRIELLPPNGSVPRFVYHTASEMPLTQAAELIKQAEKEARKASLLAIQCVLRNVSSAGLQVSTCGLLAGSTAVPKDLAAILRAHPLIHTAEAALFRNAVVDACKRGGLTVLTVGEREVWSRAASAWSITEGELRKGIDGLRKSLGSPWSADHKASTAIALLALKSLK